MLFKCREAIESLQDEIEDYQRAIHERDFMLNQAQEREEQLKCSKKNITEELNHLKTKIEEIRDELK